MDARLALAPLVCLACFSANAAGPLPEIQKFHQYTPSLSVSGQPRRNQFAAIAAAGYKVVVNVASADSNPDAIGDEKKLVEAVGMEYYYIPLKWEKPDAQEAITAMKLLDRLQNKPTLMHCYVGSRASLVAYLYRTAYGAAVEADEMATMTGLWKLNKGYEFENSPQWQFLVDDVKALVRK